MGDYITPLQPLIVLRIDVTSNPTTLLLPALLLCYLPTYQVKTLFLLLLLCVCVYVCVRSWHSFPKLGPLAGDFPILSLRTNKADVAVGIPQDVADKLDQAGEKWRVNGK